VSPTQSLGEQDFLSVCAAEARETLVKGQPTAALLESARRSMPTMVMQKFHNLRGGTELPHRFYELGTGADRGTVLLSPELQALAQGQSDDLLDQELEARWSIVEASFTTGIGPVLRSRGLRVDGEDLVEPVRRVSVTGVRESISGFQHGRCFYCHEPLERLGDGIAVDHVYPFSLMQRAAWQGPNLNEVWNLVLAHGSCNGRKSNRLPTEAEVQRLLERNEAIIGSPHPLRRALESLMVASGGPTAGTASARLQFLQAVDAHARWN
jgi:5-methylcytosine-specific restriction endonuclease McrA